MRKKTSIFTSGDKSSFAKTSRKMAKVLALGAGTLAVVYSLFVFHYFKSTDSVIRSLSVILPCLYLISFLFSFSKVNNRQLYQIIFYVFIISSLSLLYDAYQFSFNSDYIILMMAIFSIILFALPTTKQLLIFFGITFIPLEVALFMSEVKIGFTLLISLSFGAVFLLSYVISLQKKMLNYHSSQNAKILKSLVNNTIDAIFLVDYHTKEIWDANKNTQEIFGLNKINEIFSTHYYQLFDDENFIPSRLEKINKEIERTGYYQTDVMFKRKDGSRFLGRIHLSPFEALNKNYYLIQIKNSALRKI